MENKENEFIGKGNDCFVNIVKSYERILRTVSKELFENKYPSMTSLEVQNFIFEIIQNFEQIQIIMNESMQQCLSNEELGRANKRVEYEKALDHSKSTFQSFMSDLEKFKNQGEVILAQCESACNQ